MSAAQPAWLYWSARLLAIAYAAFLALFALDVFEPGVPLRRALVGLFIHLLPSTLLVLAVLAVAWRHPLVGAVAYTALAVAYLAFAHGRFHWSAAVCIAGPLLVLGALFAANWWWPRPAT